MMFFQYAIWGVWAPYITVYLTVPAQHGGLGFTGGQTGWIVGIASSCGAIAAPFIAGQVADRYLHAQTALAFLLISSGAVKFGTAYVHDFDTFFLLAVLYSVLYMPTLSLTNSMTFVNLPSGDLFGRVRLWGTVGWIVAGSLFPLMWLNQDDPFESTRRIADSLRVAGVLSAFYAVFCLTILPRTPPTANSAYPHAHLRALSLLGRADFLVLTLIGVLLSMVHQAHYIRIAPFMTNDLGIPIDRVGVFLSLGQWSEIVVLIVLGRCVRRFGYRAVLVGGGLAYTIRFIVFALARSWWTVGGAQLLHGVAYGFFFVAAYQYIDAVAPRDVRHSTQTVFGMVVLGVGPIMAGAYNSAFDRFVQRTITPAGQVLVSQSYREFWFTQGMVALMATLLIMIFFRPGIRSWEGEGDEECNWRETRSS